jgi:site-specific recombinase XerD
VSALLSVPKPGVPYRGFESLVRIAVASADGQTAVEVGLSPTMAKFLWKYIHLHRAQADDSVRTLFTNLSGRLLSQSGVDQILQRVKEAAGITNVPVTAHKVPPHIRAHLAGARWRGLQPLAADGPQQREDHRDLS